MVVLRDFARDIVMFIEYETNFGCYNCPACGYSPHDPECFYLTALDIVKHIDHDDEGWLSVTYNEQEE